VNRFVITLDKKINGTFTADLTADYPVLETAATSSDAEKSITLNFNALTKASDISLYVPLPLGTYNSLGLALYDDDKAIWTYSNEVTNTISRKSLKLMPSVSMGGSIGGEIEGGDTPAEPEEGDYVDEYGINHGQGVEIDGVVWAPVNCGYHATDYKYGKLYQWGRKYGQGYDSSDASVPELVAGPVSLATGQSKDNENKFYYNSSSPWDWCDTPYDNLWNSGTEDNPVKTEYDPCPSGWRVPTYAELEGLIENYSSWTTDKNGQSGYWFSGASSYTETVPQVFFPAVGALHHLDGRTTSRGTYGGYWSSCPDGTLSKYLTFLSNILVSPSSYERACGNSVRCVQAAD
jgi:uncharacterized protein (TIGR02145 family)